MGRAIRGVALPWAGRILLGFVFLVGAGLGALVLVGGSEDPLYTIEHEIEIDAPPDHVWSILSDFEAYPEWNPYVVRIEGQAAVGARIRATLVQDDWPDPVVVAPTVVRFEPGRLLAWHGEVLAPGLHDTDHGFELTATSTGRTRLRQYEEFRGGLARFVPAPADRPAIARAFQAMNQALAARAAGGN